jgi:putative transposase
MIELLMGLTEHFVFYNTERPHQSLHYRTPDNIYESARGAGTRIVDKYSETEKTYAEIELKKIKNRATMFNCSLKAPLLNSIPYCLD